MSGRWTSRRRCAGCVSEFKVFGARPGSVEAVSEFDGFFAEQAWLQPQVKASQRRLNVRSSDRRPAVEASPPNRDLTSQFAYGLGYLKRPEAVEVDPVSLSLADLEAVRGQPLFPINGVAEFGGVRDAAPAGGARPKTTVRDEHGALWLAKFPATGDAFDVARAEACTLELARRCGLTVLELRYLRVGGKPVMLIRRFDRYWAPVGELPAAGLALHESRPGTGRVEGRIPFASGLTLVACSEFESRTKGYADLSAAIRKHVHPPSIKAACQELFARMVFNIFASNDDDHLRNHGFVFDHRQGGWALSPLDDVVPRPGFAYERMLHLQVGDEGKLATLDNALSRFAAFTAARADAVELVRRVWSEVRQWKTTFEAFGADAKLLAQMASVFRELEDIASPELVAEIRNAR